MKGDCYFISSDYMYKKIFKKQADNNKITRILLFLLWISKLKALEKIKTGFFVCFQYS